MKKPTLALLVLALILSIYGISTYNGFVQKGQAIDSQWAQVEMQYQRRFDLIPNLVSTAKGYMDHEKKIFIELAEARKLYANADTIVHKDEAMQKMDGALGRLLAIAENYPDLKANQTMLALMDELAGTENRIATERMRFNEKARSFNTSVQQLPSKIVAKAFGFKEKAYLKSDEAAHKSPKVDFN